MPLTKAEWKKLEPKLRFRAFTVAKLGTAEEIEKAKKILTRAIKDGETYAATWQTVKETLNGKGTLNPNYWETVFRTNTQSAYIAGKLQKYQETNVKAFQLMVIEDSRTSPFCRNLLNKATGYGMILPVKHQFWKTYGFPPYHFNCRTSISPVYGSMIGKAGYNVDNPSMNSFRRSKFKPQKGFGGNPVDKESWWKLTAKMIENAEKYGIWPDILQQTKNFDMISYQKELLQGYELIYTGKNGGYIEKSSNWEFSQKEMDAAKKLADEGHQIYLLPRNRSYKVKSPDCLIDGEIAEFKQQEEPTKSAIAHEIKKAKEQRARIVYVKALNDMEKEELKLGLKSEVLRSPIKLVFLDWKNKIYNLTRRQIRELDW